MNKSNTNYLLKKYPKIFIQHKLPMSKTAMCWGFQHGDGWLWLVDNLCEHIQNQIKWNKYPQVEINTIKEKFGTLSIYVDNGYDGLHDVLNFVQHLSSKICEDCGTIKNVECKEIKYGYIMTLCKECRKRYIEKGK